MAHFLYKTAILPLYSAIFLTFDFNVVSPLQKLIGSMLSLPEAMIKNGTAHIKQLTSPTILPTVPITSINFNLDH